MTDERHTRPVGPTIAIVGSGPSGCYTAQFLRKDLPEAEITVFEALPVPYGLVRYGVAADHQGTKAVAAQFERMFTRSDVTFVGNTRVGADIDIAMLTESFDVVVVATGLMSDRGLPVPTQEGARIVGAGRIIRALNAFPDAAVSSDAPLTQPLGRDVVVVGHGNVAIDVVRLLTKSSQHFRGSDVHDDALATLRPTAPATVRVIGRSSAENAKCDLAMLRELCTLETVRIAAEGLDKAAGPVADLLRAAATAPHADDARARSDTTTVTFHFEAQPTAVRVDGGRTLLDVTTSAGTQASYAADTLITAIGFCHDGGGAAAPSAWAAPHVYRVGWFERGGRGNIAENRKHAQQTAKSIVADLRDGRLPTEGRPGLSAVREALPTHVVHFAGWQAIDAVERGAADADRCRRKVTDIDEMLSISRAAGHSR